MVAADSLAVTCAHTNTVKSFNATIRRAIAGLWHWFSIKLETIGAADRGTLEHAQDVPTERFGHILGTMAGVN